LFGILSCFWEDILKKLKEKWCILRYKLGQVHVSESSAHDHLFGGSDCLLSLGVTGSSEDGKNVSEPEIIMSLFGQLFLTQFVKNIELVRQWDEIGVTN